MTQFLYEEPGYYRDTTGERWLVGEDPDGDLAGINVNSPDPVVQYWDPCGRVRQGAQRGHARDLIGLAFAKKEIKLDRCPASNFHHRSNRKDENIT